LVEAVELDGEPVVEFADDVCEEAADDVAELETESAVVDEELEVVVVLAASMPAIGKTML